MMRPMVHPVVSQRSSFLKPRRSEGFIGEVTFEMLSNLSLTLSDTKKSPISNERETSSVLIS